MYLKRGMPIQYTHTYATQSIMLVEKLLFPEGWAEFKLEGTRLPCLPHCWFSYRHYPLEVVHVKFRYLAVSLNLAIAHYSRQ